MSDGETSEIHDRTSSNLPSSDELKLERFGHNLEDIDHDQAMQDSDEDDDHHIAHHPLLGMLAGRFGQPRRRGSSHKYNPLHPVTSVLTFANVDECLELEKGFPEHERGTREKFEYRLARCPELSFGIYTQPTKAEAEKAGKPSKPQLVAMIVATRTPAPSVTDASMDFPKEWKTSKVTLPKPGDPEPLGHQEVGGTICIHSLAVHPEHRNKGLATVLLKAYIQRIKDSKIADRLALLAHSELESFYSRFGFENMGPSKVQFGNGNWTNMVLEFSDLIQDD